MKLTKEDIKKYGTEEEQKELKEGISTYEKSEKASEKWKIENNYHTVRSCALCRNVIWLYEGVVECTLLKKIAKWDLGVEQYGICDKFRKKVAVKFSEQ